MSEKEKPQAYVARYSYIPPKGTPQTVTLRRWYLPPLPREGADGLCEVGRENTWDSLLGQKENVPEIVRALMARDVTVLVRTETREKSETLKDFHDARHDLERRLDVNGLGWATGPNGGIDVYSTEATVRTLSALGQAEHKRRRTIVENFLREWNVEFSLECLLEFSSNVCAPLNVKPEVSGTEVEAV